MMPIMDGIQLLKELKGSDDYRHIPVLMLTARSEMSDRLQALRIGVDDYMLKPFIEEELSVRVSNLVTNAQKKQSYALTNKSASKPNIITEEDELWLRELEKTIQENMSNNHFNVDQMSQALLVSRRQLFRNIKQFTGLTPNKYLQEFRLQSARELIEKRKFKTIKAVAFACGFSSLGYFSKVYKSRFGMSPSEALQE